MNSGNPYYKELYHFEGTKHTVVMNEITGKIGLKKTLKYFDVEVYECLKHEQNTHIPKVYDYWRDGENLVVIEEFIQGVSLDEYIAKNNVNRKKRYDIIFDVLDALVFLHTRHRPIIHRDLKMTNILISSDGIVKVVDFDAAKIYKPQNTKDTTLIGTEGVAAPEQYGFAQSDERSDIYAAGVLIRQLLPKDNAAVAVAEKATKIDPEDRYRNVKAMVFALQRNPKSLWPVPGFRTLNPVKMTVAILSDLFFLYVVYDFQVDMVNSSFLNHFLPQFMFWAIYISEIDLFCDWFHLFGRLPMMQSKNKGLKILFALIYAVLIVVFWFVVIWVLFYIAVQFPGIHVTY